MQPVVIVGTGMAGYTVARELRKLDSHGADRDDQPRRRQLLFEADVIERTGDEEGAARRWPVSTRSRWPRNWARGFACVSTSSASCRHEHTLVVDNALLGYSKLVLATGADPRRLQVAGDGAADVLSINDLDDYARFRLALTRCRSVAILGAGLIGCEFANDLAAAGYAVNLIDPASTPLARLLPRAGGRDLRARARAMAASAFIPAAACSGSTIVGRLPVEFRRRRADRRRSGRVGDRARAAYGARRGGRSRDRARAFAPMRGAAPARRISTRSAIARRSTAKCSRTCCRSCMRRARWRVR